MGNNYRECINTGLFGRSAPVKRGLGLLMIFLLAPCVLQSQVMVSATGKPSSLVICGDDGTFSLLIANTTGATMSGATLTLDLPPGVRYTPGTVTAAAEFNITNLNNPVFTLPDILNNTAHTVTYNAGLICGYNNMQDFVYTVTYNSSDYTGYETPLQNYYYPEPVITSITNGTVSIPVNTTVTRGITIQQQGLNSSLDTLILLDEHTSDIQVLSVNIGTLHPYVGPGPLIVDTIILTGSDFPGGNGLFDQGEQIVVQETVKLVGCINGQSTLKASWGCFGQICSFYSAFPTVSPASGNTVIGMAFTANRRGWGFIDNSGWIEFTVSNTGSGAGTAFDLTVLAGFSSGGSTYYPNANWINEIDSFSVNGNYLLSGFNYAAGALNGQYAHFTTLQYTFDPDGAGTGLDDLDGDGYYDDLPVGKTITIRAHTYYNWPEAVTKIPYNNTCGSGWTASAYQAFRFGYFYETQCQAPSGVNWIPNATVLMFQTYDTKTVQHTIPPDLYDGQTAWMEQLVTTGTNVTPEGCPDDSVFYKVVMPPGVVVGSGTATFKGVSMGAPVISGDTLYYMLDRTRILSGGLFRVPVMLDCNIGHGPTGYIHTELKFWCDRTNYPNRFFTYWCSNSPIFGMQCPITNCPNPSISMFRIKRTTLGWTNNMLTAKVDPNNPLLRLDNVLSRDSVKIEAAGKINGPVDSLYFRLQHDAIGGAWGNRLFFDYISDTLYFYDVETGSWDTCWNLFPTITNAATSTLVTYFGNLTQPGQCFAGKSFTAGDSLYYVIRGQVKNVAQTEWRTVPALRARFHYTEINKQMYCNDRGFTFNVLGSNYNFSTTTFYQQIVLNGCTSFVYEGLISMSMEACGGDIAFPAEIRPFLVLDTMRFTLPEGFVYQPGSARHSYNVDYQFSYVNEVIPDPLISIGTAGTILTFIRTSAWNYSDFYDCYENLERIIFNAVPSCKATTDYNYIIYASGRFQFCIDGIGLRRMSSATKPITYTAPQVNLTNLITTAEGRQDTVMWKIRLCNTRSFGADNNWVGFENASAGITVVGLKDITIPAFPVNIPVATYGPGKMWGQIGTIGASSCRTYEVRAVYNNCNYDSIKVRHGYNCATYPVNPELGYPPSAYGCLENNSYLYLDPKDVSLNLAVTAPANPVDLCDTLDYEAEVTNTQLSYGYNLKFMAELPPGITILPGFSQFKYPYTTGSYATIGNPVNDPPGSDQWVWYLSADPNAVATLKGVDSIPRNGYRIKFRILTDCDFISGTSMRLSAIASNACGDEQTRSSYTPSILIGGLPSNVNLYVLSTTAPNHLHTCSEDTPVKVKIINLGPDSVSSIEELSVVIDDAFDYVNGSLTGIHNGPSGIAANMVNGGIRYIYFQIQPNLSVNDSIVFTFGLHDIDPGGIQCDTIPLTTNSLIVATVNCSTAPGGICSIHSITATVTSNKAVLKDYLGFSSATATSVPSGTTGETVTVNYTIYNSGTDTLQSTNATVIFIHDANGNGLPDETGADSLYIQTINVNGLIPGGSANGTASFYVPANKVCSMIAALRLSDNPCICSDDVIPVNNIRLFNAGVDTSVCQYSTIRIGMPGTAGYTYNWIPSLYLSQSTVADPLFTFNNLISIPATLQYVLLTTRTGNCLSRDTMLITVYPMGTAYAGKDTTVCEGTSYLLADANASNFSSILWFTTGTGSFSNPALENPVYNPSAADVLSGSVQLAMTVQGAQQCGADTDFMVLSFSRYPLVYAGKDTAVCANWSYLNPDATAQYYSALSWSTTGDGSFNNPLLLHPAYTPGPLDQSNGFVKLVLALNGLISCPVVRDTMTLNLVPPPSVTTSPLSKTICSEAMTGITLTANQAGATFIWTATLTSGSVTGFSNGSGPLINQQLFNNDTITGIVTYAITPATGGCIGTTVNYTVTVLPLPLVTNSPPDTAFCSGGTTDIVLRSDLNFATFSWTASASSGNVSGFSNGNGPVIAQILSNSGSAVETVSYVITALKNGCSGPAFTYTVTVNPIPGVSFVPSSQAICSGQATAISLVSGVSGATFSWTASTSSPNVTGFSAGSGNTIAQVLQNSGNTIETATYTVTPSANGCSGTQASVTVTVYPTPDAVAAPPQQTFCSATLISINLSSAVTGTTFTWTASATSGNVSGYTAGSGNLIQQTIANSGFDIDSVIYLITPTANGCPGTVSMAYAIVNPVADVSNNPLSSQICSGTSPNIALTSNVTGTNFSWTATGSSPNVVGYGPGSGNLINQVLTNLGLNIETVTYHITPAANGCNGLVTDFVVTIVSIPDVSFQPPSQSICTGQTTAVNILSGVAGATFTWTASGSSPNVSGYSAGSGNLISQTLANSGMVSETVTYTVYPEAFGCPPGPPGNVVVTVFPEPAVNNLIRQYSICSATATNIPLQSSVSGSSFTWTASCSSPNVTGYSAGSGPVISQVLSNSGFVTETVSYIVIPSANGCPGDTSHFQVNVYPVPDVIFTPPAQSVCSKQWCLLGLTSNVAGTNFNWTATGTPTVSGYGPGAGDTISQQLFNSGLLPGTATYSVLPFANGCPGLTRPVVVTINPLPPMTFTVCFDTITTTDAQPFRLKGGIPLNGSYSGPGVAGNTFAPAVAGPGTHIISYSYINTYTCTDTARISIHVFSPLAWSCGNSFTDLRDNNLYPTVQIGGQCWMAAGLNYGSAIASANMQRDNCITEKYCFNNLPANCTANGGLYQWDELMRYEDIQGVQGLCPAGWHVPSEADWNTLFAFYINNAFAGAPLLYTGYSGFNALLSGARFNNVNWNFLDFATMIWSSTSHGPRKAWAHGMNFYDYSVSYYPSHRNNSFSVRCIKD
jgi:uncharacterized protein (TIGR02145 family)